MSAADVGDIFQSYQKYLDEEQDLRENIRAIMKELESLARDILTTLQAIHQDSSGQENSIMQACAKARELFKRVAEEYEKLAKLVPDDQYYRYHDHWRFVTQRLCFLASLVIFLEVGILVTKDTTAEILGLKSNAKDGFHLELEDYLMGILQLSTELARFAVNAVTSGDYDRPLQISKFVADLNAGFRLLNLKNDSLRKRFDVLKYDVKKIEEVVYDLTIRGLKPGSRIDEGE